MITNCHDNVNEENEIKMRGFLRFSTPALMGRTLPSKLKINKSKVSNLTSFHS